MCSNCRGGCEKETVRLRDDDHVAVVLSREFPDRVQGGLPFLDRSGTGHVGASEINVKGLTRGDLENKGLSAREIGWILANS